jgi:hypothetical protein
MRKYWLNCQVLKGMFSDERTVVVRRKGNGTIEFIVSETFVNDTDPKGGKVQVTVIERGGTKWAVLPTSYSESIPVDDSELVSA